MSEKIDIIIDSSTDVEAVNQIVYASSDNNVDVEILEPDYDITINKKEYIITGDNLYIPKLYEESPQWLRDIIATITDFALNQKLTEIGALSNTLYGLIEELEVAKNTYTQSIISSADIDERINTAITTLNSSIADSDATIVDLITTKATPAEATSLALNVLTASINDGAISSLVGNIQNAISTTNSTLSNNIDILHSEMTGEFEGTADAIGGLRTYVGVSNDGGTTGTGLLADVEILQKQNDGIIETTTGTYDVMVNPQDHNLAQLVTTAEPYVIWKAADVTGISNRLAHIGDVYVKYADTANGAKEYVASYKFIRTVVDDTSPYATDSDGFTWALIVDQAAQDAYEQALNAYDLADNKRRVFTTTPSGPYDIGDLWTKTTTNGSMLYKSEVKRTAAGYDLQDWVVADDSGLNQFVDNTYNPMVSNLQNQVDSKIENWYTASTSDPKSAWTDVETRNKHDGDLWYQTDTKLSYYYSSSTNSWNLIDDAKAIQALSAAATAQATADGVVVSYYAIKQDAAPATANLWLNKTGTKVLKKYDTSWVNVSVKAGDTLTAYDPDTKDISIYVYNGSSWITNTENGVVATSEWGIDLNAYLDNKAVGGTSSLISDITATSNNNLSNAVNSRFAYNSNLVIDGVTYPSGFGLSNSAGTGIGSEFWINADKFKFTNNGKTGSNTPFSIDASGPTPQITFNGKVTFGSGQTGTIDQAIAAVVETVAVGDKNINITDNLIPTASLVADTENSGYQFVGTPTKSMSAGLESFSESQIALDGLDEVYSPYVDEVTIPYYYRFGIKGITSGSVFKIVTIDNSNAATSNTITITMDNGQSIISTNWYIIEGIINPYGGSTAAVGSIRNSSGIKIGTVSSFVLPSGTSRLVLGWVANCTISRIKLCKVTADTVTSDLTTVNSQLSTLQTNIDIANANALARILPSEVASAVNNNTTTINGSKITTGSMSAKTIYTSDAFVGHTLQSIDYNGINGFILKSNAAGTSVDPTIYGAYIKGSTLEGSSVKLREITVLTDSNHETKAVIGASSILSGSIWTYGIYPYNSTASTINRLAKSSNNTVVFAGNTVNSNVSSYVSYRGWVSLAVSTGGVQSGSYPYIYNNVLTVTIDGTSHTFSADTQISPYTFPCGLTLVTVFTITNINTGSGYTCLFIKPYCDSFTLTSGTNLTISVSNLAGSLIMDSRYGNEVIVYNI